MIPAVTGSVPGNRNDIDKLVARKKTLNDFKVLVVQDTSRFTRAGEGHGQKLLFELRAEGIYEILSPEECRRRAKERGDAGLAVLHPLCAGIPIDRGWECLQLYADSLHDVA